MVESWILDMDILQYERIRNNSQTPVEVLLNVHQLQEYQKAIEVIKFQIQPNAQPEWILFVAFKTQEQVLVLSHICRQLPSFLLDEVFAVIERHRFQIQNNKHVMNHFLNQNGFKNYDLITREIFLQEMQSLLETSDSFTVKEHFKDYFFLFQATLNRILKMQNVISLVDATTKNLLFDFLNIENSLKDLNNDYLTLFFLNQKKQIAISEQEVEFLGRLIPFFQGKVEYHLSLLVRYLNEFLEMNKNKNFTATEINEDFQSIIIHLSNLKEFFADIISSDIVAESTEESSETIDSETLQS